MNQSIGKHHENTIFLSYSSMKVINLEGVIRPFDDDTKGFVRSESVGVLFMQKAKDAKRVYGTVSFSIEFSCYLLVSEFVIYPNKVTI